MEAEKLNAKRSPFWNPRPILLGAVGALLGGVLALNMEPWVLLVLGGIGLGAALFLLYKRIYWCVLPLVLGLTLLRGIFLPRDILPEGRYPLSGQIVSLPEKSKEGERVLLGSVQVDKKKFAGTLEVLLPLGTGGEYGDRISCLAAITPVQGDSVAPKLRGSAEVRGKVTVYTGRGSAVYKWVLTQRRQVEKRAETLFAPYAGEAKGMLLGIKEDISYVSYRAFVQSGLVHLLTVSGLHVGILCGAVLKLIRGRHGWLRGLLAGLVLLLYASLTGFSSSTLRAAIMVFVLFLMRTGVKQEDSLGALGLAFSLLVLWDPGNLTSLGFQLSFGSVWGLYMLTEPLSKALPGRGNALWTALCGSIAASLGTLPLLAQAMGEVQWAGIFLSPMVIPVAALFLVPAWLAIGLHALWPPLGALAAILPRGVLGYISKAAWLGSSAPLPLPAPGWVSVILWYTGLFFLSPYFLPNKKEPPRVGYGLIAASLLCWLMHGLHG